MSSVLALAASSAFAQDTVMWNEDIRGWSVAIDRTIEDSCFIISGFEDQLFLRLQFNAQQQNVQFIVANVAWESLETGQEYGLEVIFGEDSPWSGMAQGHIWQGILPSLVLSVPFEDQQASKFMEEFSDRGSVRISYEGNEIANLALSGTGEAVASMMACQQAMAEASAFKDSNADPFAPAPDPI
ncbi:MAG: hypothetical protein AAFY06_01215 [Pseudomonadota bacterium]